MGEEELDNFEIGDRRGTVVLFRGSEDIDSGLTSAGPDSGWGDSICFWLSAQRREELKSPALAVGFKSMKALNIWQMCSLEGWWYEGVVFVVLVSQKLVCCLVLDDRRGERRPSRKGRIL